MAIVQDHRKEIPRQTIIELHNDVNTHTHTHTLMHTQNICLTSEVWGEQLRMYVYNIICMCVLRNSF